ncbi:MAG: nucleotide exchange factor GrpE [Saprospiraceae bacterium]
MKDKHHDNEEQLPLENHAEQADITEPTVETGIQDAPAEDWQQQLDDARNKYLYLLSDFENYKRNAARERLELQQTAGRDIMAALLSVLDDFDRAAKTGGLDEGMTLIHHKLLQTLQGKGLAALVCNPGEPFDPDTQEAVAEIPAPAENLKGNIVDIVEKGYLLGDRIIRYSKVVVGK